MKDVMSVFGAVTGRNSRYSAVNTNDVSMQNGDNVYNPTTTSAQHPKSQSLDPSFAVFDRFLNGRLGQKKERRKCKCDIYNSVTQYIREKHYTSVAS